MSDPNRTRIVRETYKGKTMKSSVSMIVKSTLSTAIMAVVAMSGSSYSQAIIEKSGACPTLTRYTPSEDWTTFPIEPAPTSTYPVGTVQNPLTPQQSINCLTVPVGLKAQIMASELTPGANSTVAMAYLMHYTFDEKGRIWAIDTRDYPYKHYAADGVTAQSPANIPTNRLTGQSRIVIIEDADKNGTFESFKVFFTGLAIPTSIEIVKNGVIVSVPPNVYYIPKSGSNPDTGGVAQVVVASMGTAAAGYDSHGQINSLTRGLDNFIYGHLGYNSGVRGTVLRSTTASDTTAGVAVGTGNIWRFKSKFIGSDTNLFQIHSNNGPSNAHGIGQMEDGQWFKSGATGSSHNNHQVRDGQGAVNIELSQVYYPATQDRYLWEGSTSQQTNGFNSTGSSAASGSDFYTARLLPQKYWNRFSFVCEGASKLCNQDSLVLNGSTWSPIRMPGPTRSNIFVSTDAWTAPLKVRTGPEGALWVNDWYNYLFLHNPASPSTMSAWNNALRAKSRTRLYRIVPAEGNLDPVLDLSNATSQELVQTLYNRNFFWRMQAQRILVERGVNVIDNSVLDMLDTIITTHRSVDVVGIDGPVIHAVWALHGMRQFATDSARWNPKLRNLLLHPAWTVRRNVILAMPATAISAQSIGDMCAVNDVHAHVRVQALQNLTRMPVATGGPLVSLDGLRSGDTHIGSAYTAAGASKVTSATGSARPGTCPAYMDTTTYYAGHPGPVSIGQGGVSSMRNLAAPDLRFNVRANGFTPIASDKLVAGDLTVSDLRGHVVFRSSFNKSTRTWSQASASNMVHPFYFYSFKGVNGATFNGRIAMDATY
jgi:putative membrane-bound dehydrogenase-like protein